MRVGLCKRLLEACMKTVTVRQLALRLGVDSRLVKGIAMGLGIHPERVPMGNLFSEEQAKRIETHYRKHEKAETPR